MKISKKVFSLTLLFAIIAMLSLSFVSLAQTDSLAVWENIADGTLTSTWQETSAANWKGQNVSGVWTYNCTSTNSVNWTYNNTIHGTRWMHTWEVTSDDAETGIGSAQFVDATNYYAVMYYLSFNGATPALYIIYNDDGVINYWNGSGFETNRSNATDYTNLEKDYLNGYIRIKAIWNWNETGGCSIRFKAWEVPGAEINYWLMDTTFTKFTGDIRDSYYSGIVADHSWDATSTTTLYRRIFFWNLSYTMTPALNAVIRCPTVSATDLLLTYVDAFDTSDVYNSTQLLKTFMNQFDLISMYSEAFYGNDSNQNDTVYTFNLMLTDCVDLAEQFFPVVPDDFPDNILYSLFFVPTDGSSNGDDFMQMRIDTDNDGNYEATDLAFWTNDTNTIVYEGWTPTLDWEENLIFASGSSIAHPIGEIFRDDLYYYYGMILNWDAMYNGSSGERIMDDQCRISYMWYDNDTDNTSILQDFAPTDDDIPYIATDERNISNNPTFSGYNTSTFWVLFNVDEDITGEPLADPVDEIESPGLSVVMNVIPILASIVFFVVLVMMMWSQTLTVETLVVWLIAFITAVIAIVIMTGFI